MSLDDLASKLSDPSRIGLSEELAKKLGVVSREATRGRLMAQVEGDASHLGVYLLATYVVDDTDFWGDGEIYWWCIPALGRAGGRVRKEVLAGLPSGAPPHKVGSLEWMTNLSLNQPPLLAVIPPEDDVESCVLRVGFYDDDGARAGIRQHLRRDIARMRARCVAVTILGADGNLGPLQNFSHHQDEGRGRTDKYVRSRRGRRGHQPLVNGLRLGK